MTKLRIALLISLLAGLALTSCSHRLSEKDFTQYVEDSDNGLVKETEINSCKIKVMYKPSDLLVKQELVTLKNKSKTIVDSLRNKYNQYRYFILSMAKNGDDLLTMTSSDKAGFSDLLNELSFNMDKHVYITTERDTAYLIDFVFPRLYETSHATHVLLVFNKNEIQSGEITLHINDFGGMGNIHFDFTQSDLNNVPLLEFSKN